MPRQLIIPNPSSHDIASYNILIDGAELNNSYQLQHLSIFMETNRIPAAKIVLRDGEAAVRAFQISDTEELIPGKKIEIKIGLDGNNTRVFAGIITKHSVKVKANGNTQLELECKDEFIKLATGRKSRYFENMRDDELVSEIIGKYQGLSSETDETTYVNKEIVQHNITDWDFILLRAEANGMLININAGKLSLKKPATSEVPVLQVNYGSSIIEFEAEMDAKPQWQRVKTMAWNYQNQELADATTEGISSFRENGNLEGTTLSRAIGLNEYSLRHSGFKTGAELQAWADAVMLKSRMSKIKGRVKVTGFGNIFPGDMMEITGIGNRFNGNAMVSAVQHDMGTGDWETNIQFGIDNCNYIFQHDNINDSPAAGLTGGIQGLQIGVVAQLENDPGGEDRILVRLPAIDANGKGIWSRVCTLDAGNNRGSFFRPEIGDEVIVGFINSDPNQAIVMGMLNSSAKPAPLVAKDNNHEKGIFTRSKMRLLFNDDTNTITIDTPAGNKIKIDEQSSRIEVKDSSNNEIILSTGGIKLSSPLNVDIEAGVNLSLKAGAMLSIGGTSLGISADGNINISGAKAALSANGITEIKGSLVKIN